MSTATPSDVRVELNTSLDDSKITEIIERVSREIERELAEPPDQGTDDRQDLEATLAALFIATSHDRAEESTQSGRSSVSYEQSMIDELKARAKRLGATDALLSIGVVEQDASVYVADSRGLYD